MRKEKKLMLQKLKNFKWGYVILTLLIAAGGVCFIAFRETLSTIALIIGITLSLFATVFAIITIADKRRDVSFALKITFAVIALSGGIITIVVHKSSAVEWLVAIFGLLLIIDGSFKLHTSAMSKRYRSVGWWLVLIPAILVIVGGFITIRYQLTGTSEEELLKQQSLISVVLGVTMIIDAIGNLLSAFYISSYEKKMKNEHIKEYTDSLQAITEESAVTEEVSAADEVTEDVAIDAPVENGNTDIAPEDESSNVAEEVSVEENESEPAEEAANDAPASEEPVVTAEEAPATPANDKKRQKKAKKNKK